MSLFFLCTYPASLLLSLAVAQQQTPPQYAPATKTYSKLPAAKPAHHPAKRTLEVEEKVTSVVTIRWNIIPRADRYVLSLARDPEFNTTFFTVETKDTSYTTPELPPGPYYYQITGFEAERAVGKIAPQRIVVAKPLTLTTGGPFPLPAPGIIQPQSTPTKMPFFPAYGKVRLAWQAVDGARGYRVRLWDENKAKENARWKKETPARWVTEVKQPWIVIRDAPYASYMYLDNGIYRWDVAAVDNKGGVVGDTSTGYFEVSRQWYVNEEIFFRPYYSIAPNMVLHQHSSEFNTDTKFNSVSHHFGGELDWFFLRQWGFNFSAGTQSFDIKPTPDFGETAPSGTVYFSHFNFDLLYRQYLSTHPNGWTFIASAGLGLQEYPQVDSLGQTPESLHVSRPKGLGAKLGFRFYKRWDSPWEFQLRGSVLLQAFTLSAPTGSATTKGSFNGDISIEFLRHWSDFFALGLALGAESRELSYTPSKTTAPSSVSYSDWLVQLRMQFHWTE